MKKTVLRCAFFLTLCALLVVAAVSAAAETDGIYTYTVSGDAATITGVDFSGQNELSIPESLGGYPVTAIGSSALTDRTYQFEDDTIAVLRIPKTVTVINNAAFSFADIAKFFVDEENPAFSSDDAGVLYNKDKTVLVKAPCCLQATDYTVPQGVTELAPNAFEYVFHPERLSLPDTLRTIGQQAFYEMENLRSIALPEGVTAISQNCFAVCTRLEEVTFPSTLQSIRSSAFTECSALRQVLLPEGVTFIGQYAFESDSALERIVLPASLTEVGRATCGNCPALAHVYYAGSAEDWAALNVRTGTYAGTRTDAFDTATFHYNFDAAPYASLQVQYDNDLLTLSGSGSIPAGATPFQFWDEHKDTVTALFLEGDITAIESGAFSDFPNLAYVIADTGSTAFSEGAFTDCPLLSTVLCFGDAALNSGAVASDADAVQVFVPQTASVTGSFDRERLHVIPFAFADGVLSLNGSVTWDSYQFLDTMTAFCLHFNPVNTLKCSDFTFNALPLYGTNKDGDYERIEDNRLTDAELRAQAGEEADLSFNELVEGIVDGSITSFRLIAKDSEHEEIKDTPVEIKEEQKNEGGFIGAIKKAIKWIVRLLDTLLNIISKLRGR